MTIHILLYSAHIYSIYRICPHQLRTHTYTIIELYNIIFFVYLRVLDLETFDCHVCILLRIDTTMPHHIHMYFVLPQTGYHTHFPSSIIYLLDHGYLFPRLCVRMYCKRIFVRYFSCIIIGGCELIFILIRVLNTVDNNMARVSWRCTNDSTIYPMFIGVGNRAM